MKIKTKVRGGPRGSCTGGGGGGKLPVETSI